MAGRRNAFRWLTGAGAALCALCFSACMLSFDDYAEGDPCAASLDAGLRPSSASDPVLRGCEAGAPKKGDDTGSDASDRASEAGASGMAGEP